jgi:hypothetical protein
MRDLLPSLAILGLTLFATLAPARADELPQKAPSADAKPHVWSQSVSKGGLRSAISR